MVFPSWKSLPLNTKRSRLVCRNSATSTFSRFSFRPPNLRLVGTLSLPLYTRGSSHVETGTGRRLPWPENSLDICWRLTYVKPPLNLGQAPEWPDRFKES